jgi:hypothetical protein
MGMRGDHSVLSTNARLSKGNPGLEINQIFKAVSVFIGQTNKNRKLKEDTEQFALRVIEAVTVLAALAALSRVAAAIGSTLKLVWHDYMYKCALSVKE